ncbi:hypothetical protein [Streptomyces sp. WG-D5]
MAQHRSAAADFEPLRLTSRGAFDRAAAERTRDAVAASGVRDLFVLVHAVHNDDGTGDAVDAAFLRSLDEHGGPETGSEGRAALLGVQWPSLLFRDETLPGRDPEEGERERRARPRLTEATRDDLLRQLPDSTAPLREVFRLLDEQPAYGRAFDDLGSALRRLAEVPLEDVRADFGADMAGEVLPQADPLMLFEDTHTMCAEFAGALDELEQRARDDDTARQESDDDEDMVSEEGTLVESRVAGPRPVVLPSEHVRRTGTVAAGGRIGDQRPAVEYERLWAGAHELFRQVVRHVLRRRAGLVGELGLAPCLRVLAEAGDVRLHLVGHGLGGRAASFALRGLAEGGPTDVPLASLTLLQAEMSHFAFAGSMPQQVAGHGALWELERLVDGPLICTFTHLDLRLGLMYPLSAQMVGDAADLASVGRKWGALGFDGIQGVEGPPPRTLEDVLAEGLPESPYTSVDVTSMIGSAREMTTGGHHLLLHPDTARLVRTAAGH